jgi:hypothetical protein
MVRFAPSTRRQQAVRHFPEGFHADRFLRFVAVLAPRETAPRPLASTRLDRRFIAGARTGARQGPAPILLLAPKRHK